MVGEAIAKGQVGERYDGYLDFVATPEDALRRAVRDINIRRRLLYGQLAERRSVAPREVGITAGCNLMARTPEKGWYQLPEGWQRRAPGQPVALPDYCGAVAGGAR
nr:YdbL family protein [Sphingomicrobium lutaoense]